MRPPPVPGGVRVPPAWSFGASAAGTSVGHRCIEGGEPAWPLAARSPHALVASEGALVSAGRSAHGGEGRGLMGTEAGDWRSRPAPPTAFSLCSQPSPSLAFCVQSGSSPTLQGTPVSTPSSSFSGRGTRRERQRHDWKPPLQAWLVKVGTDAGAGV